MPVQEPALIVDRNAAAHLVRLMADQTSGYSLEQLEQIYSAIMRELWRTRGAWDRSEVVGKVGLTFENACCDIHAMQSIGDFSMESRLSNG